MITPPPDAFDGLISEYVEAHMVPNLPSAARLLGWMEALVRYYSGPDPICIVRGPRKGELRSVEGHRVVDSDNAPGIWCYLRALDGRFDPRALDTAIEAGRVPVLAALKGEEKRDWDWNYAKTALAKRDSGSIWDVGLKHCHILPVKPGAGLSERQRALRNLCPANHFLFPNGHGGKRYVTQRIGWNESPNQKDLSESARVISWVQHRLVEHLQAEGGAGAHRLFVAAAGGRVDERLPVDGRIRIERVIEREASAAQGGRRGPLRWVLQALGLVGREAPAGTADHGRAESSVPKQPPHPAPAADAEAAPDELTTLTVAHEAMGCPDPARCLLRTPMRRVLLAHRPANKVEFQKIAADLRLGTSPECASLLLPRVFDVFREPGQPPTLPRSPKLAPSAATTTKRKTSKKKRGKGWSSGRGPVTQRDMMRRLWARHGSNRARVIAEYAAAERRGEVERRSNVSGESAESYAARLLDEGFAKGWL